MNNLLTVALSLVAALPSLALAFAGEYRLDTVFQTRGVVWSFAFLSADEMLVSRRDGKLFYVNTRQGSQRSLPAPPVVAAGQGGLLDVHIHAVDGQDYVYLTYAAAAEGGPTTALDRGVWNGHTIERLETLFTASTVGGSGRHFGSRLLFHGGHIYMTIGDRAERDYAQDLSVHNGKILRLDLHGRAAAGNPFAGVAGALPEIWTYGHRNPQGIAYERRGQRIYSAEFGPRGGDELNLIEPGKNYGWPVITYGREYFGPRIGGLMKEGMEQPLIYWVPSISPSGITFYYGDQIPQWRGSLFLANLSSTHLRRLTIGEDGRVAGQEELFAGLGEALRHVREGPDGALYFSTDQGRIVRVSLP